MKSYRVTYIMRVSKEIEATSPEEAHQKAAKIKGLSIATIRVTIEDLEEAKLYTMKLKRRKRS